MEVSALTREDILRMDHVDCYGCRFINNTSMVENETYNSMMRMYTQNAYSISRDALFRSMKAFFDTHVVEMHTREGEAAPVWTLDCIREHFTRHTNFPSDEIRTQLVTARALRDKLTDHLMRQGVGGAEFEYGNIKVMRELNKEILTLLNTQSNISSMVGYCVAMNY